MTASAWRRFWSEVRRRHVARVALGYVAGAWVVAQAGSLLFDAFDAPHYTRYLIAAIVAGLPLALTLAWVFDITPHGIVRTLASEDPPAAGVASSPPAPDSAIAVLPFANLSGDPANEYFSDGLAEEIRNQLSRVPGLQVAARTSSFAFKGRAGDVREIGRQLNVGTILEGGVRKHAGTVRIDVQLVGAADGYQVWSETFERQFDDIFRLQSEVAAAVMTAVTARTGTASVNGNAAAAFVAASPCCTRNVEAYNAYLLGRHHFHKRRPASLQRAEECFAQAIALDPDYALAYCGLADTIMLLSARYYGNRPAGEAIAFALPAARRALELAPELAESHASLGMILLNQTDLPGAEAELRRAVALNPGYVLGHLWLGLALNGQGRYVEAAQCNRDALRLDPLSPIVNTNVGFDALRFGDEAESEARFAASIEIDPGMPVPYSGMAHLRAIRGDLPGAFEWIDRALALAPSRPFYHARKALLFLQAEEVEPASASVAAAQRVSHDAIFDAELLIALHMARKDVAALRGIATGAGGSGCTAAQRGQAWIALGDRRAALEAYLQQLPDPRGEVDKVVNDDWVWRVPHAINRAHLLIEAGDARGRDEMAAFLAEAERVFRQGVGLGEIHYWAATAHAVLGDRVRALVEFERALQAGWRHAWWARMDWNLELLRDSPQYRQLVGEAG